MKCNNYLLLILLLLGLLISSTACEGGGSNSGSYYYPTYPYDGGGYKDYGSNDYEMNWSQDIVGEWEGFIQETYRSDNIPISKKILALRCRFSGTTWTGTGRHEWVKVDVLVDGRPAGSSNAEISRYGYLEFYTRKDDITFALDGRFVDNMSYGDVEMDWNEKVEIPYLGKVDLHHVYIRGDYSAGRVRGTHWASAWDLFDRHGDGVWDLGDEAWQDASREGMIHMQQVLTELETLEKPANIETGLSKLAVS